MPVNQYLRDVIDAAMPLFVGEAEVVRSYFGWSDRTAETDRKWIAHQCFKEFYGFGYGEPEHGLLVEWGRLQRRMHTLNGQFSYPLSHERTEAIYAGDIEPIAFDNSIMGKVA